MANYLRNTLFVEDLLEYLFKTEGIEWKSENGVHSFKHEIGKSPYLPVIGWAVDKLSEVCHKQLTESHFMLLKEGIKDKASFSKYALQEACNCFSQGYSHECFLAYCVLVLGVSNIFYFQSSTDIIEAACQVVVLVLFSHQMTGEFYTKGGWSGLVEVARKIDECFTYDDSADI